MMSILFYILFFIIVSPVLAFVLAISLTPRGSEGYRAKPGIKPSVPTTGSSVQRKN